MEPLQLSSETLLNLEDNLILFFTGYTRSASRILEEQDTRSRRQDASMIEHLHFVKQLGHDSRAALGTRANSPEFAEIMHVHWEHKKKRSSNMSNQPDRRMVPARDRGRCSRREDHWGGRWRFPHVLYRTKDAAAPYHA